MVYTHRVSLIAQLIKNRPAMQETPVRFLGWEDLLEKGQDTHSSILGLPCGSAGKESSCNARDLGSISELGRSPGEGKGYQLQYSGLENSVDCIVHEVTKSQTWLSDFHFHYIYIYHCIHGMEYYSATKKRVKRMKFCHLQPSGWT